MANPCPCELIVNESLSNNPPTASITDSTINDIAEDKLLEDYLDQLSATSQQELSLESYPLYRQIKSLDTTRQRSKRPSWAAVGKRAATLNNKQRPSWAQVG